MSKTTLDENRLNTKILGKISTIATDNEHEFIYQSNGGHHIFLANHQSNSSVCIENLNYMSAEQVGKEYSTNALERLIYSLLKEGKTNEAKSIISRFDNYSSPLIDKWRAAFSRLPAKEDRAASLKRHEIDIDSQEIDKYKDIFASQWVALAGGKIIAANIDLLDLKKEIKSFKKYNEITFIKL